MRALAFDGAADARPHPDLLAALRNAEAVVICPSNPFISIDPILAIPGLRAGAQDDGTRRWSRSPRSSAAAL